MPNVTSQPSLATAATHEGRRVGNEMVGREHRDNRIRADVLFDPPNAGCNRGGIAPAWLQQQMGMTGPELGDLTLHQRCVRLARDDHDVVHPLSGDPCQRCLKQRAIGEKFQKLLGASSLEIGQSRVPAPPTSNSATTGWRAIIGTDPSTINVCGLILRTARVSYGLK